MDINKLYNDYFSVVYKYILSVSKDPLTAEEITQETFFKALKNIDGFRGGSSIKVWLCQIAKNAYYDQLRRQSRQTEMPDELSGTSTSYEDAFIVKLESARARKIIHGLKEPYKEVFTLRVYGELSFSEIGELFDRSDNWARVTFHRARLMIKEEKEKG